MRSIASLFLLMILTSCLRPGVEDRYRFSAIYNLAGDTLVSIGDKDFMEVTEGGSFHYELEAKDLIAEGTWDMKGKDTLVFTYSLPLDTIRYYRLEEVSDRGMTLKEGDILFTFDRK